MSYSVPQRHFEIPQTVNDIPEGPIEFLGTIDKQIQYKVYTSSAYQFHKYKLRGANKPYAYIDTTPNYNNMYDGWIFNSPLLETISVIGIFKDPRQVALFDCCAEDDLENYTFITTEIKKRLIEKKIRYYRLLLQPPIPNNQTPR